MGVFGKKKSGKSTFIKKIFEKCETNSGYDNSTIGINIYKFKDTKNFLILDSPGDTEIDENIKNFISKGYKYSKIFIYIMSEEKLLDSDSLKNNTQLKSLVGSRLQYNIPLLVLLTHSDDYCSKVKNSGENWKMICKNHFIKNKNELLGYINKIVDDSKSDFKFDEKDILHVVLVGNKELSDEEIIKEFDDETKEEYDNAKDEEEKKLIIRIFARGLKKKSKDVEEFIRKEIKVLGQKELVELLKKRLPSQYHNALIKFN